MSIYVLTKRRLSHHEENAYRKYSALLKRPDGATWSETRELFGGARKPISFVDDQGKTLQVGSRDGNIIREIDEIIYKIAAGTATKRDRARKEALSKERLHNLLGEPVPKQPGLKGIVSRLLRPKPRWVRLEV